MRRIWLAIVAGVVFGRGPCTAQNLLFTQDIGGSRPDGAFDIEATADGGFIVAGFSESFSPRSLSAVYLAKVDADGQVQWTRSYDDLSEFENIGAALVTLPDGYAIAGRAGTNGEFDSFLIRTDLDGNVIFQRTYDAGDDDRAHALAATSDGGFILAGQAWFGDDLFGNYDMYVVKTDGNGNVQWTQTFEYDDGFGAGADIAFDVIEVSTGGYAICGYTQSSVWDGWVIRTDELGVPIWDRLYAGGRSDELTSIRELDDGGFILGGLYATGGSDVDLALVRTDSMGMPIWTRTFGERGSDDQAQCVRPLPDGGFILAGFTSSYGAGSWDMYLVRTDASGNEIWSTPHGGASDDRVWGVAVGRDRIVAAGWAWSFGAGQGDMHLVAFDDPGLGCPADMDGSGVLDGDDFFFFLDLFASGDARADLAGNGVIDVNDFFAFLDLFAEGC